MLGRIIRKNRPGTLPETNQDALRIDRIPQGNITRIPTIPFSAGFSQVAKRLAFLLQLVSMAQHGRWARCRGPLTIAPAYPIEKSTVFRSWSILAEFSGGILTFSLKTTPKNEWLKNETQGMKIWFSFYHPVPFRCDFLRLNMNCLEGISFTWICQHETSKLLSP